MVGPIKSWRKALERDLDSIIIELSEIIHSPAVLICSGEMGAGKTTFIKHFVNIVAKESTSSPSYSLVNEAGEIVHADFYRIENADEITHLELPMYMEDKKFFLVEWGMDYFKHIRRELGEIYHYYELQIEVCGGEENSNPYRNFHLVDLDKI